jgi:alkylhydroperoxidase family enzyme
MTPRIVAVTPPYDPDVATQLQSMMPPGAEPIGLFRTFVQNMPMTRAMGGWGAYELGRGLSLTMRQREIVIDRTCARCGCEYEWGVHVAFFAERVGLTTEQVRSITHGGPADGCWADRTETLLVRAVDALHETSDIDDALWQSARDHFDEAQMLDVSLLCGWYHAISFAGRAARVALEPGAPRFADVA